MVFLKTCYECGSRVDKIYDGKCESCFKNECPPIIEIKPVNIKYCNNCKKIHYQNQLITQKELVKRLPEIVKKNILIDEHYTLNELVLHDIEIRGEKVSFEVEADCSLK